MPDSSSLNGQTVSAAAKDKASPKGFLAFAYAIAGAREEALRIMEEIREDAKVQPGVAYGLAMACTKLGMNEEAVRWLEMVHEWGLGLLSITKVDPIFAPLRSEPRFQALLRKIGHAE
jgi:hypothetical protein